MSKNRYAILSWLGGVRFAPRGLIRSCGCRLGFVASVFRGVVHHAPGGSLVRMTATTSPIPHLEARAQVHFLLDLPVDQAILQQ